jgi:hypothetical protein
MSIYVYMYVQQRHAFIKSFSKSWYYCTAWVLGISSYPKERLDNKAKIEGEKLAHEAKKSLEVRKKLPKVPTKPKSASSSSHVCTAT